MGHGRRCLSAVVVSLLVSGTGLRSSEAIAESTPEQLPPRIVALTTSQDLLATDSTAIVRFLETTRPAAVSTEEKARILSTLPLDGEVTDLSAPARQKGCGPDRAASDHRVRVGVPNQGDRCTRRRAWSCMREQSSSSPKQR